jgi:hypothetical protein
MIISSLSSSGGPEERMTLLPNNFRVQHKNIPSPYALEYEIIIIMKDRPAILNEGGQRSREKKNKEEDCVVGKR